MENVVEKLERGEKAYVKLQVTTGYAGANNKEVLEFCPGEIEGLRDKDEIGRYIEKECFDYIFEGDMFEWWAEEATQEEVEEYL